MNSEYIIALIGLIAVYVAVLYLMKYARGFNLFNFIFCCMVVVPYVFVCITVYRSVGFYDWNFQNVLPVANVSPFMFCTVSLLFLLPKKLKSKICLLISLLTVGMFLSSVFGCIYNASIGYRFHFHFLLDYVAHMSLSLFGIYLVRTKQVKLNLKNSLVSGSIIVGAAIVMMVLNVIFDTSFFGLSLNGKHSIYNNVLVDNSYISALLYFTGLVGIMAIGYAVCKIFDKNKFGISNKV